MYSTCMHFSMTCHREILFSHNLCAIVDFNCKVVCQSTEQISIISKHSRRNATGRQFYLCPLLWWHLWGKRINGRGNRIISESEDLRALTGWLAQSNVDGEVTDVWDVSGGLSGHVHTRFKMSVWISRPQKSMVHVSPFKKVFMFSSASFLGPRPFRGRVLLFFFKFYSFFLDKNKKNHLKKKIYTAKMICFWLKKEKMPVGNLKK